MVWIEDERLAITIANLVVNLALLGLIAWGCQVVARRLNRWLERRGMTCPRCRFALSTGAFLVVVGTAAVVFTLFSNSQSGG